MTLKKDQRYQFFCRKSVLFGPILLGRTWRFPCVFYSLVCGGCPWPTAALPQAADRFWKFIFFANVKSYPFPSFCAILDQRETMSAGLPLNMQSVFIDPQPSTTPDFSKNCSANYNFPDSGANRRLYPKIFQKVLIHFPAKPGKWIKKSPSKKILIHLGDFKGKWINRSRHIYTTSRLSIKRLRIKIFPTRPHPPRQRKRAVALLRDSSLDF